MSKLLQSCIICVLSFQLVSCGTIIYPERKGQKDGRLDVGVVLLDGIGLLFFLIPGVIAYAVDFSNGTIYLPSTNKSSLNKGAYRTVKFDQKNYTPESLEAVIRRETGRDFHFNDKRLQSIKLKNTDELSLQFLLFQENTPGRGVLVVNK